ncbi:MAG: hypothetical protein JO327_13605 [Nitrososphaeraceae archaeon]|nr:hypothetical protein [Nitrososphaeraceae archaeon]
MILLILSLPGFLFSRLYKSWYRLTGFNITHASQYYYTERAKLRRRKYAKLSIGADVLKQIIYNIKVRRAPTRHDNIDRF